MALKFGPQWLRDLSDGGTATSQPNTPTAGVKFKLAEYRYGREEMLSLFNDNSPPPDQVRKHLPIFSTEIQKPITMSPLTEDEQRLISQGFNSTVVLRAAGRGSGPPLRGSRGGGTADRGRGRGRGRGEGYLSRENGDVGYARPTQDGWEQVGRKFERSYSRGYEESGTNKREYSRSSSDNWRDKRYEDEEDEDGGIGWRGTRDNNGRWGSSARTNWRDPQRDLSGFEGERKPSLHRRGFDQDPRGPRRTSESYDNEGEVPEWVEDDVGDDPGTFDSSGAFVATKDGRRLSDTKNEGGAAENNVKRRGPHSSSQPQEHGPSSDLPLVNSNERAPPGQPHKPVYIPPNARNGTGDAKDTGGQKDPGTAHAADSEGKPPDTLSGQTAASSAGCSNKGDGDSGLAVLKRDEGSGGTCSPPAQNMSAPQQRTALGAPPNSHARNTDPDFLQMEKSLQNLVAEMTAEADKRARHKVDVSQGALPLTHEDSNKWFYKDPQGEVQGPFTNEDMAQWFSAGYFTMSLVVKRGCDDSFKQLGELIKRYGRVPFLPGPPLPPLISSSVPAETSLPSTATPTMPSLVTPVAAPHLIGPGLPSVPDPLMLQQMLLQQELMKQTLLMRQMQMQTLQQMQEQESFKNLPPEQQQHLSMQMMMQANPMFMQQMQQLQLQLQQQQQLLMQQQQQEQQRSSPAMVPGEGNPVSFHPASSTTTTVAASTTNSGGGGGTEGVGEEHSVWGAMQQLQHPAGWSQPPVSQPTSLWDVESGSETLSPAYQAQLEKMKREREEANLKAEERMAQGDLEKKQEELRRQQEELERQREQMRREKEELEKQKQLELQKIEETRRLEEERRRREIEKQQREQQEEEKRRQEEDRKRAEEERRKERELKKQEEKRRKEEEKRKQQEEQRRQQEELRRKKEEEEEMLRQQQLLHEQELRRKQELQQQLEQQQQRDEEERMERERLEAQRRQQFELQRQQESLRRLQQAQREKLANMQLPASSTWAAQQVSNQCSPSQSRSLTEIQEEEARREEERQLREQQLQQQRKQEQAFMINHQQQQKSWATHASQGIPAKSLSLLDIQQQEQESAQKSQKEKPNNQPYHAKLTSNTPSTWSNSTWGGQAVWASAAPSAAACWDQVPASTAKRATTTGKESGEFPALKNPAQQSKKNTSSKSNKTKGAGTKQRKEEESVQKLFDTRQQDDFSLWVMERVSQFSSAADIDVPTFVSFIVALDSPDEVRDYVKEYLGDTKASKDFAKQFVEKRNHFRNQARLEKQQEEDSIWGPAPAINPHAQGRGGGGGGSATDSGEAGSSKSKNRKKKQKMQKLDGSILGFTVHADPNRKNAAGEVESIQ